MAPKPIEDASEAPIRLNKVWVIRTVHIGAITQDIKTLNALRKRYREDGTLEPGTALPYGGRSAVHVGIDEMSADIAEAVFA